MVLKLLMVALALLSAAEGEEAAPEAPASAEAAAPAEAPAVSVPAAVSLDAKGQFLEALLGVLTPEERVAALEQIVKDHPRSVWADDALWILGETARQMRPPRHDKVIYYWQILVSEHPHVELEEITRTLGLYQASGLPQVEFYLVRTGRSYVLQNGIMARLRGTDRVLVNARAFNAVPMCVWEGLAQAYRSLGKHKPALAAYRMAYRAAPNGGPWRKRFDVSIGKLERLVRAKEPEPSEPADAAEAAQVPDAPDGEDKDKDDGAAGSD